MTEDRLELFLDNLWGLVVDEDDQVDGVPSWIESWFRGGEVQDSPIAAALSWQTL